MWKVIPLSLGMTMGIVSTATAASCREELTLFARQYDLAGDLPRGAAPSGAAEPPATQESRGVPPTNAPSGAVVAPPEGSGGVVVEPREEQSELTPPSADVQPNASQPPPTGPSQLSREKRARMEALLQTARAAEAQGNEAECFKRLSEARATPEPG
jgi:hypothetical protein